MELYNTQTKQIENISYIQNEKGTFYVEFLSPDELLRNGYKPIKQAQYPSNVTQMQEVKEVITESERAYEISYEVVQKSLDDLEKAFKVLVQGILDTKAKEHGYDSIVSACSYAGYDNEFRTEGEKFGVWRAHIWQWGYALLADIKAGKKAIPASLEEALAGMPKFDD